MIKAILKALIALNLIPIENYSKQQVLYFYQIVHFKIKLTKIGSFHLDTPSLRYDFCKIAFKSEKQIKLKHQNPIKRYVHQVQCTTEAPTVGPRGQWTPRVNDTGVGHGV